MAHRRVHRPGGRLVMAAAHRRAVRAPAAGAAPARLLRFDRTQRAAHWGTALLFGILILTALPLYFSSLERLIGRHALVAQVHLWAGIALPVPIVLSLLGPWGARMRRDLRRINRWTYDEVRWLRSLGRQVPPVMDKFNPGQKLNAIFVGGTIVVMLGTGLILQWFGPFPVSWRTGATLVHEVLALVAAVVVAGHVGFAVTHREALRSMVRGRVSAEWAARHAPRWLEEERARGLDEERGRRLDEERGRGAASQEPAPPYTACAARCAKRR
jgi:formate dehydrogenase subunit gamma